MEKKSANKLLSRMTEGRRPADAPLDEKRQVSSQEVAEEVGLHDRWIDAVNNIGILDFDEHLKVIFEGRDTPPQVAEYFKKNKTSLKRIIAFASAFATMIDKLEGMALDHDISKESEDASVILWDKVLPEFLRSAQGGYPSAAYALREYILTVYRHTTPGARTHFPTFTGKQ